MSAARVLLLSGLVAITACGAVAQQRVGIAGAVNPATTGQPPGGAVRTLVIGADVVFNEKVVTTADGQTQILFLDRSALNVGPNSEIVIDEFVYDPKAGTGKLAASVTKGVFRFVGGALSKNEDSVNIKTPSATIGIRGGMVGLTVEAGGPTTVLKLFGNDVTVSTGSGVQRIVRNDFYQTVDPQGRFGSSTPALATARIRQSTGSGLNPTSGGTGGATQPPTASTLTASGFAQNNSVDVTGAKADASSRTQAAEPATVSVAAVTNSPIVQTLAQTASLDGDIFFQLANFLRTSGTDLSSVLPGTLSITDVSQLPLSSTAGFSGPVIGATSIDGVRKIETSATFSMAWIFPTNTGTFQILNFANSNFIGTISSVGARNTFTGTLTEVGGGSASGTVKGAFYDFSSHADVVAGSFFGSGKNGSGVGLFRSSLAP